jgi:hypothetical protein
MSTIWVNDLKSKVLNGSGQTVKVFPCMKFDPNVPLLEDGTLDRLGRKVVVRKWGR